MATRAAYASRLEAQLKVWDATIAMWSAKADKATAMARIHYENELDSLRSKRAVAHNTLENLGKRSDDPEDLVNATIVAGDNLRADMTIPPDGEYRLPSLSLLVRNERAARVIGEPTTDDRSDTDYVQAPLRIRWRTLIWDAINSSLLWD